MASVKPLLVIVGETASGKSDLALRLAEDLGGELICADSWTVRRGLDIGTAKPSKAEQARAAHHLLDVVGPADDYSAALFKKAALNVIDDIQKRQKLPIMVGGTGLYIDGVIFDYNFLPAGAPGLRAKLDNLSREELLDQIEAEGLSLAGTDIRNKRRLIRLLETGGAAQTRRPLRTGTIVIGLQPDRAELTARISRRVDAMLAAGLQQEVAGLAAEFGWQAEGLKGIGYREWQPYFETPGGPAAGPRQSLETTRQRIISSTASLAKRQRTWFKRNKSIQWFSTPVNYTHIVDYVTTELNKIS